MPRRISYPDKATATFPAGTFERIERLLDREVEDRTDFFREAIEREIRRRERLKGGQS
ncbi:MAG: hypothetical protein AAFR65_10490 [Pseudomonadota bacterium]